MKCLVNGISYYEDTKISIMSFCTGFERGRNETGGRNADPGIGLIQ